MYIYIYILKHIYKQLKECTPNNAAKTTKAKPTYDNLVLFYSCTRVNT